MKLAVWSPRPVNTHVSPHVATFSDTHVEVLNDEIQLYALPVLQLLPVALSAEQKTCLMRAEALFFVSQHAVMQLLAQVSPDCLADKIIIAIGRQTQQALQSFGVKTDYCAKPPYNSEALLAERGFDALPFSSLAIVGATTGRQLLTEQLRQRGKKVTQIACYRRDKTDVSAQDMLKFLNVRAINAIILTSCEIAEAVTALLTSLETPRVWRFPVFALSPRIGHYAKQRGFHRVYIAENADKGSLYQCMTAWQAKHSDDSQNILGNSIEDFNHEQK